MPRYSNTKRVARRSAPWPRRNYATQIQAAWRGRRARSAFTNPLRHIIPHNTAARMYALNNLNFDDYYNQVGMEAPSTTRLRWDFDEL